MYMAKTKDGLFINTHIRENGRKVNIFDKINKIKADLKILLPEIEDDKLITMFSHCRNFHYGKLHYGRRDNPENWKRKRKLTKLEQVVYEYILKNKLNPSTSYRWLIACRIPSDVREQLAKGKISYKIAMQIADNRKRAKHSTEGLLMMEDIRNIIQKLEWE